MADSRNLSMSNVEDADHKVTVVFNGILVGYANTEEARDWHMKTLRQDPETGRVYALYGESNHVEPTSAEEYRRKVEGVGIALSHWIGD